MLFLPIRNILILIGKREIVSDLNKTYPQKKVNNL